MQRWLHGRLVGVNGRRPCAKDSEGTYTCVVTYRRGTRSIVWNPTQRVAVNVRSASFVQRAGQRRTALSGKDASIPVGYLPVLVVRTR